MTKILLTAFAFVVFFTSGNAQVKLPAPSPTQTIKQDFGTGDIELTYSRPSMKERKIFGDLVPYYTLWRTGANAATKIIFSEPVNVGGKKVDSGSYVLYTIPGIDAWEVILNKGLENWGTEGYKETQDIVRFKIEPKRIKKLETFTMEFSDITADSCTLDIKWERTSVSIPITENFKPKIKMQIEAEMKTDKKPYWQAAQFYNEYDKNLPMALDNVTKAIAENKEAYWMWIYKAKIQKELGDMEGAMVSSKKSMELAEAAKNKDYVKMNKDLQKTLK